MRPCSFNVDLRGNIDKQMEAAEAAAVREGRMAPEGTIGATATAPKHTWWWRLAHVRTNTLPADSTDPLCPTRGSVQPASSNTMGIPR